MKIDIGKMTPEETVVLCKELMAALTEEALFSMLEEVLTKEQKEALGESWFNIDS